MKKTFKNPILENGADPWLYKHQNGCYYFMCTLADRLELWRSRGITDLGEAERKTIWNAAPAGPGSKDIWAPELHRINGKWYVYFTASDGGGDETRRIYVLENESEDPFEGKWTEKGAVNTAYPGLDGTVLQHDQELYFLYAGYGYYPEYGSAIYIAKMINPWTLGGDNVLLTKPEYGWEKQGGMAINEGPVALKRNGRIFIIYSASTTWSEDYCLGMLSIYDSCNLLSKDSWKKSEVPVFKKCIENMVVAPGHNSFTKSPDDKEDWIIFHAISGARGQRLDTNSRSVWAQPFYWNDNGYPEFGKPLSRTAELRKPSGELEI
ncbi:MAG TPA: family 43 glycosylhydrolase [Clostridiaceae bacterium]|nr:family 43 glycosylhydrolase [Clostridiaceae bacterium]